MLYSNYQSGVAVVMRALCFCGMCLIAQVYGVAQDVWHPLPAPQSNPNTPQLFGIVVNSKAKCAGKELDSRVVISGKRGVGIYRLAFWMQNLSTLIPERDLWSYMGPDLAKEAKSQKVIKLVIRKNGKKKIYNLGLNLLSKGNYPVGASGDGADLFDAYLRSNIDMYSLIQELSSGFDAGYVVIGEKRFNAPVEMEFSGNAIAKALDDLKAIVGPPKEIPNRSSFQKR